MMSIIPFWTLEGTIDIALLQPQDMTADILGATLAKINRFNGRTPQPWSVASHSVLVSYLVRLELAPWALLHDAHEAFLGDITFPAVELLSLCGTRVAVQNALSNAKGRLDRSIGAAWGVSVRSMSLEMRWADFIALKAEASALLGTPHELTSAVDIEAHDEAVALISDLPSVWQDARDLWVERVAHYTRMGLLTPPQFSHPTSMPLAG